MMQNLPDWWKEHDLSEARDWLDSQEMRKADRQCWWVAAGMMAAMIATIVGAGYLAWWWVKW